MPFCRAALWSRVPFMPAVCIFPPARVVVHAKACPRTTAEAHHLIRVSQLSAADLVQEVFHTRSSTGEIREIRCFFSGVTPNSEEEVIDMLLPHPLDETVRGHAVVIACVDKNEIDSLMHLLQAPVETTETPCALRHNHCDDQAEEEEYEEDFVEPDVERSDEEEDEDNTDSEKITDDEQEEEDMQLDDEDVAVELAHPAESDALLERKGARRTRYVSPAI